MSVPKIYGSLMANTDCITPESNFRSNGLTLAALNWTRTSSAPGAPGAARSSSLRPSALSNARASGAFIQNLRSIELRPEGRPRADLGEYAEEIFHVPSAPQP